MGTRVKLRERRGRLVKAALVVFVVGALGYAASAASLGGVDQADLFAWSAVDSVRLPLAFDHFDSCAGNLNNDVDVVGNPWSAPSTDWRCQNIYSRARNRNLATAADSAVVDVGRADKLEVSAYLERTSRLAAGAGSGLSLFHDGSGFHMYVVYQRGADRIVLGKVDGSGDSDIVAAAWLPRSGSIELLVIIDQPTVTVVADGTTVITHTMTAAEQAAFGSNTRFGMESDLDRRSRWSWFQVEDTS